MIRSATHRLSLALFHLSAAERYPTRTVEHMLAWMMVIWSGSLLLPGAMLAGAQYEYLIALAPEQVWGSVGVMFGVMRLVALVLNGSWRRSPGLRLVGAMTGMIWWIILSALYWVAVQKGAADFPMRYCFAVFTMFEAYSCYRCGQDHASPRAEAGRNGG